MHYKATQQAWPNIWLVITTDAVGGQLQIEISQILDSEQKMGSELETQ